jgi:4-alpha-glucanotransferase
LFGPFEKEVNPLEWTQTREIPNRSAGILFHPTSLPGPYGIGDLGPAAYAWIDALARAGQTWWQVLPLGPTGFGDSPYQSFSAFAGNPYLVSPDLLVRDGLLQRSDVEGVSFPADHVDYGPVITFKTGLLERAWEKCRAGAAPGLRDAFEHFGKQHAAWLDDFALFMALKDGHGGKAWSEWPRELVLRQPATLDVARKSHADRIDLHRFRQFLFFRQWEEMRRYAQSKGIRLIGDLPIFVSADSVDVWANHDLFLLDAQRRSTAVAGVPPDYFSRTGQLWGNPLYNWDALRQTGYAWWLARLRASLSLMDMVRLDHFRGFEAYWEVPANMPTAEVGRWVPGPRSHFFQAVHDALGGLPLIAEDLGLITPAVEALREEWHLPGMRVLQFAFSDGPKNVYLPHHYVNNTVVYTGTHDNDTTHGWFAGRTGEELAFLNRYVRRSDDISWDLIHLAWSSVADYALTPLQDVLSLGTEARMNMPGRPAGNWGWRLTDEMPLRAALDRLAKLTDAYGRGARR